MKGRPKLEPSRMARVPNSLIEPIKSIVRAYRKVGEDELKKAVIRHRIETIIKNFGL